MAWRRAAPGPGAAAVAVLEAYAAAAQSAERLAQVRSWLWMLGAAGGDPEIGELFLEFAREDEPVGVA